ncbi:MAG: glucose 1-dehydrogenase [Candidatus Binatia bacterium]|nr:glucose 1-dehydrogenase [Candidatus Binatia bacterium]
MVFDRFRLDGKVAIITGAGRGIGAGCARALAEAGADIVGGARTLEQVEAVAEEVRGLGRKALAVACDVLEREQLENLVAKAMDEFGRIDILVNNAGGYPPVPALRTSEKAFEECFRFNVTTAFLMSRFTIPHMLEGGGGSIVNISSSAGRIPMSGFVAYGTAKSALTFMTREFAMEFAPRVRVNAIAVGSTDTSSLGPFLDDDSRSKMEELTPMKRLGEVEDIAIGAMYLASPAASFVTGKVLEIDGGLIMGNWPFPV